MIVHEIASNDDRWRCFSVPMRSTNRDAPREPETSLTLCVDREAVRPEAELPR